jgi:formylglycine-generating enzyme required for sulfatase activity
VNNFAHFLRRVSFIVVICLNMTVVLRCAAQTAPSLGVQIVGTNSRVTVTAEIGSPVTLQYTTNLGPNAVWTPLTTLTMSGVTAFVTNPVAGDTNRFYRALISVPTNMAWITPGTFAMGSPANEFGRGPNNETQHTVTLTRGFFAGRFLVTQSIYRSIVNTNPSYFNTNNGFALDLTRPVEQVTWADATNFCNLLTSQERAAGRILTNWSYRLPTEAEWEYSGRAGTTTQFYYGTNLLSGMANFNGQYEYRGTNYTNYSGIFLDRTTPVGAYQPNAFGLYDMVGNVWEWVQDWYAVYSATPATDPTGPATGTQRIFRGGSLNATGALCRSANRNKADPTTAVNTIGFRVVLSGP